MTTFVFPGQGSQQKGMGAELFDRYPELVALADRVVGYSLKELCLHDPKGVLTETQFTQPALFVVNALTGLRTMETKGRPSFAAGHSLGEFNALLAAEVFDFETGLRLVQKRGDLMSRVKGGGMAAVVGLSEDAVGRVLRENGFTAIDIANRNTPSQFVISGPVDEILKARPAFEREGAKLFVPLRVSAPFHSRHLVDAQKEFQSVLETVRFASPQIPVISNVEARPYPEGRVREVLSAQITSSVRWTETIQYLMARGETEFVEAGPGSVLSGLIHKIRQEAKPLDLSRETAAPVPARTAAVAEPITPVRGVAVAERPMTSSGSGITPETLGSAEFRKHYGVRYAYVAGSMYKGVASPQLVVRMAKAGMLSFLGTGGLDLDEISRDLRSVRTALGRGEPWGANLPGNLAMPKFEEDTVELFLKEGVRHVEASGFMMMTPALVHYRLKGAQRTANGQVVAPNSILAKVSRPEVAEAFMSPPPEHLVEKVLRAGGITTQEAELAPHLPMAEDICVECDSGGPTDQGMPFVLVPAMLLLRDRLMSRHAYPVKVRLGAAGGIGTPEAAAAVFMLGADFILTGSINQCTVEAGTSAAAKDMLEDMDVQHTEYAPAGDLFELGARVQVLRRGVLFPARANKLYDLYMHHDSLEAIDEPTRRQIQEKYFRKSFEEVWQDTCAFYRRFKVDEIEKAERNPKHKMGLIFRWYFVHTMRLALEGSQEQKVDYQIYTGPALGAFNQWVKGTGLEKWRNRHVDAIAEKLMGATALVLNQRIRELQERIAVPVARVS